MMHRDTRTTLALALLLLAVALLSACGSSRVVRREGESRPGSTREASPPRPASRAGGFYTVRSGDTMYGIAFRHGMDYRELAALNQIPAPYTIYPGQRLRLRGDSSRPASTAPTTASTPRPAAPTPAATSTRPSITGMPSPSAAAASAQPMPPPPPQPPASSVPTTATPTASGTAPASPPPVGSAPVSTTPSTLPSSVPGAVSASGWRWPAQGQIISRYVAGDPTRQGINIAGSAGQPVVAAGDGVVVYSGAGLVGYGELIIIKHNDEWLSAYAHNKRRLVTEGTRVQGGQTIAELGRSGTSRDMLHFEIRRNGKPVDPLPLLPAK